VKRVGVLIVQHAVPVAEGPALSHGNNTGQREIKLNKIKTTRWCLIVQHAVAMAEGPALQHGNGSDPCKPNIKRYSDHPKLPFVLCPDPPLGLGPCLLVSEPQCSTVEIRYSGTEDVYKTRSFRCQNSGHRSVPTCTAP
jgi:hypothetical protein